MLLWRNNCILTNTLRQKGIFNLLYMLTQKTKTNYNSTYSEKSNFENIITRFSCFTITLVYISLGNHRKVQQPCWIGAKFFVACFFWSYQILRLFLLWRGYSVNQGCPTRGQRCNKFISRFFIFCSTFSKAQVYLPSKHTKIKPVVSVMSLPPKNLYNKRLTKICQFFRFGLHPYKLATLRATIGFIITSCYSIKLIKIRGFVTSQKLIIVTAQKRLWPANVKVARNTEKVGQVWCKQ